MSLRIPSHVPTSPTDLATCEHVLERLVSACGPVIDATGIAATWDDDPALIRYSRDALNMFATLGVVEHVRRDLWVVPPIDGMQIDQVRLAAASRACGAWSVAAGGWALELRGVLPPSPVAPEDRVAFVLTPRRARPATYSPRVASAPPESDPVLPMGANASRHVTPILGRSIAAVTRPVERIGAASWVGSAELGGHVLEIPDAFVSMLEHPRLSGGAAAAREAALPVLGRVGLDAVIARGASHPVVAVRRRLAFVLMDAVMRTHGCATWFEVSEWGRHDDEHQRWNIPRALDVIHAEAKAPTLLDPHRERVGRYMRYLHVLDNRDAPIVVGTRRVGPRVPRVEARGIDPWGLIHPSRSTHWH